MPSGRGAKDRSIDLLIKAIRSLPADEQDEALKGLFRSIQDRPRAPMFGDEPVAAAIDVIGTPAPGQPLEVGKQSTQPLLVRLPVGLHERLRAWSTEHGFSMAAVARGLIERFLDQQEHRR